MGRPLWTAIKSSKLGQSRIRFNAASIIYKADLQGAYSRPAGIGEGLVVIIDLDIEGLVGT